MKQLKYFLLVAAVALSIVGCRKTIEVSFEHSEQELKAQGDSIELALKSNGEWTISSTEDWVVVAPMSGNGDATLTITAEANTTGEPRSAEVTATTKDNTAVLTLTQGVIENYVNVMPKEVLCGSDGGEFVIELSANVTWFVSAPNWITCSPAEGSGDARITLTVSSIDDDFAEGREAEVFVGNLAISDKVHVVQTVEPVLDIVLTPNNLVMVNTGETKTVAVTTEDGWTAAVEDDWVTLSQTEGQGDAEISVTVAENPDYVEREAVVLFTTAGGIQTELTIRQEAALDPHFLEVSPLEIAFGKEGGECNITIGCDTDWVFDLDSDWLSLSQQSGVGDATVVLTAEPNLFTETRSMEFSIKSGVLSHGFTVSQAAGDIPLVVSFEPDTVFVPYVGGIAHVQLTSNTSWQLQTSSWISMYTSTSGEGDAAFDIIVDSYTEPDDRFGFVKAVHGNQVIATLAVVQEGKYDILETDITHLDVRPEGGDFVVRVTSNQEWVVSFEEYTWLNCSPKGGFGNGSFTITVDALPSIRPRTASIKVSGSSGAAVIITINQQ